MSEVKNENSTLRRIRRKKEISEKNKENKKEMWAKARFHWNENVGGTWTAKPNLKKEEFTDGEEYDRPIALFELLNESCRVVRRTKVKKGEDAYATWVKTNKFNPRLYFEILERYEKEV